MLGVIHLRISTPKRDDPLAGKTPPYFQGVYQVIPDTARASQQLDPARTDKLLHVPLVWTVATHLSIAWPPRAATSPLPNA